jgi:hypothetical protein
MVPALLPPLATYCHRVQRRSLAAALLIAAPVMVGCSGHSIDHVVCPGAASVSAHPNTSRPLMCPEIVTPQTIRYIYAGGPGCVLTRSVLVPDARQVVVNLRDTSSCRDSLVVGPLTLSLPHSVTTASPVDVTVHYQTRGRTVDYRTTATAP